MLILPGSPAWAHYADNMPSTPHGTNLGTAVTAGASNADGSAVSALSVTFDVEMLMIGIGGFYFNTANTATLLDVLVDRAGGTSWSSLIDDLISGMTPTPVFASSTIIGLSQWYAFPLWIPAGSSIGLQARTVHSSTLTGRVVLRAYGGNRNPGSWWCGQKVSSIGINAAASKGTDHTPGNTGTLSSFASLGSPISYAAGAAQLGCHGDDSAASTSVAYRLQLGVGGVRVGEDTHLGAGSNENIMVLPRTVNFVDIPAGAQLQVRGTGSTNAQTVDVAAYLTS